MRIALKRRLERLEGRIGPTAQRVLVIQQPGETRAGMGSRLERWKAGETVNGIDGIYEGGELHVIYVCFVTPGGRIT